jgi:hypothetical protein
MVFGKGKTNRPPAASNKDIRKLAKDLAPDYNARQPEVLSRTEWKKRKIEEARSKVEGETETILQETNLLRFQNPETGEWINCPERQRILAEVEEERVKILADMQKQAEKVVDEMFKNESEEKAAPKQSEPACLPPKPDGTDKEALRKWKREVRRRAKIEAATKVENMKREDRARAAQEARKHNARVGRRNAAVRARMKKPEEAVKKEMTLAMLLNEQKRSWLKETMEYIRERDRLLQETKVETLVRKKTI